MWPHAEVTARLQLSPLFPECESQGLTQAKLAALCLWVTSTSLSPENVRRVRGLRSEPPRVETEGACRVAATPGSQISRGDPNRFAIPHEAAVIKTTDFNYNPPLQRGPKL